MKIHHARVGAALFGLILISSLPVSGQEEKTEGTEVTSNSFRLDLPNNQGLFTGEVRVNSAAFNLEADELVVYFDEENQVERLVARGDVKIFQPGDKSATCRQAEYILETEALKLTGDPVVMQEGNRITGTVITIFTATDRMDVEGRTKAQFFIDE